MEKTVLSWTVTNWITVILMATLGFMILGLFGQVYKKWRGSKTESA